jgi:crossover junction endodeoxyribonuclease RuvC
MRVIGLDLSLAATGIAWESGVRAMNTPAAKIDGPERLVKIRREVCAIVRFPVKADLVVIEGYSYGSQNSHAHSLGELGGVIRVALFELGVAYVEVPPQTLKMFAAGTGAAKKEQVVYEAKVRLGYQGFDNNEADALWLRALGHHALGCPLVELPKAHLRALDKVRVPMEVSS